MFWSRCEAVRQTPARVSEVVLSLFCQKNFWLSESIWVTKIPSKVLKTSKSDDLKRIFWKHFGRPAPAPCATWSPRGDGKRSSCAPAGHGTYGYASRTCRNLCIFRGTTKQHAGIEPIENGDLSSFNRKIKYTKNSFLCGPSSRRSIPHAFRVCIDDGIDNFAVSRRYQSLETDCIQYFLWTNEYLLLLGSSCFHPGLGHATREAGT